MDKLKFSYDPYADVLHVEGQKYSGQFFRELGKYMPVNQPFMITERDNEGVLVITRLPQRYKE